LTNNPNFTKSTLLTNHLSHTLSKIRSASRLPLTLPTRHYRRRYFVDPAQSHQYSGWAQGFGYATRTEEKFQPGSTHIVSALNVMEQHEFRQPLLLRFRAPLVRKLWKSFNRPWKMYFWLAMVCFIVPVWLYWVHRQWNEATRMRVTAHQYLAMGGLAMTVLQLKQMIDLDLIEFQNIEAKHQFLGVLDGVHEEVRKSFDENFLLQHMELATRIASVQPINELIKPRRQKIFHEYRGLKSYNRMVDNIHNRSKVTPDEQSLYRISNQQRERRYAAKSDRRAVKGQMRNLRATRPFKKKNRNLKKGASYIRHHRYGIPRQVNKAARYTSRWGPLALSYDNLPAFFHWGSLVALMDSLWIRNTKSPIVAPSPGQLFAIDRAHTRATAWWNMWVDPLWRKSADNTNAFNSTMGFRLISPSRINDASSLYRELERYVVQGDYIKLSEERINDPHDPLLRGIPVTILNSSDRTINGPLFDWYSRQCSDHNLDQWLLYKRLLQSELVLCKKLHDWLRGIIFIFLGEQIPAANFQRYLKFYDETLLPYPDSKVAIDDYDYKIDDYGIWDEVIAYAATVQDEMNTSSKKLWVSEFGNDISTFEPNTQLFDAILAVAPFRERKKHGNDLDLTEYERHLKSMGDPWSKKWGGVKPGDPGTRHPAQDFIFDRPKERKSAKHHGNRWDDHFIEVIRQDQWKKQIEGIFNVGGPQVNELLHEIQIPDYSVPHHGRVAAEDFVPKDNWLPWPKGFFIDNPSLDDPLYYTRKFGLGTKKDWDRLVRMGIFPELPDDTEPNGPDGPVMAIPGSSVLPKLWDMSQNANAPLLLHQRTHEQIKKKLTKGEINTTELLWLNMVRDKLTRTRQTSSFALFQYPHELLKQAKQYPGSCFSIDPEATNDLYSSNQYNNDWLLLTTLPSMYPIAPPLHEMNFMTTMVSRLEGVIMQLTAEIDEATIRARSLVLKAESNELHGLNIPQQSVFVTQDDEINYKAGVTVQALVATPFRQYQEDTIMSEISKRGVVDTILTRGTNLIGNMFNDAFERGISFAAQNMISSMSSTDAQNIITQSQHRTRSAARRLNQIYQNRTLQWLSYQPGNSGKALRDDLSTPFGGVLNSHNGTRGIWHEGVHPGEVLPLGVISATEFMILTKYEYFNDKAVLEKARNRVQQFKHDTRMFQAILEKERIKEERDGSRQHFEMIRPDRKIAKVYKEELQMTIPFLYLHDKILRAPFLANRRKDPIDRTKQWYHYQATDARPTSQLYDVYSDKPASDWSLAEIIMGEDEFDKQTLGGTGLHWDGVGRGAQIPGADSGIVENSDGVRFGSHPMMQLRKRMFVDQMQSKYGPDESRGLMTIGERMTYRDSNNEQDALSLQFVQHREWEKLRRDNTKTQIESSVTMDNVDKINRANKIIYSATHSGMKPVITDAWNMSTYNGFGSAHLSLDQHRAQMADTFIPQRTASYNKSGGVGSYTPW
jgi:hypothetical protein